MSQNKELDPSKLFAATKLVRDEGEHGVLVDKRGEWASGRLYIQLFDSKSGLFVDGITKDLSHAKYEAFREDFDQLTTEEVIKEFFPKVATSEASESELQAAARESKTATADRVAAAPKEEVKEFKPLSAEIVEATPEDVVEEEVTTEVTPVVEAPKAE